MSEYTNQSDPPVVRLGRLPHDPAALERAPSLGKHRFATLMPQQVVDRRAVDFQPGLYQNDKLPDCTAAGLANAARGVAALNGFQLAVVPEKVPQFYAACVGVAPTFEAMAVTFGAVVLDVLNRQAVHGFDCNNSAPLVGLSGVLPHTRTALANAIALLGHGYFGITLRERDMEEQPVWDVVDGRSDGGIIGGHVIVGWDYAGLADNATLRVATWGRFQTATWRWLHARLEEAHALIWRQLSNTSGLDIGVSVEELQADLANIRSG